MVADQRQWVEELAQHLLMLWSGRYRAIRCSIRRSPLNTPSGRQEPFLKKKIDNGLHLRDFHLYEIASAAVADTRGFELAYEERQQHR
jgi:hypothetical protein